MSLLRRLFRFGRPVGFPALLWWWCVFLGILRDPLALPRTLVAIVRMP